ncbi:MAG: hypothetical protein IJ738_01280 [Alphaproteobacteria bacterium]|nr:hypothetical protein [Alphaproteobacteria bacterium]
MLNMKYILCVGMLGIISYSAQAAVCYLPDEACLGDARYGYVPMTETKPDPEPVRCGSEYSFDEALGEGYKCTECTDDLGTHYKCTPVCAGDNCGKYEIYNPNTCSCDEISETCKRYFDKFKAVSYSAISAEECLELKDSLGLTHCVSDGLDYLAGAAKACGGRNNLATEDEAFELAQCMYNPTATYSSIYGNRYNGFLESYGANTGDHVFIWTHTEQSNPDDHGAIVRMYDNYGSIPYYAERDGSKYYINNGATPTNWQNRSILSETLCRR